MFPDGLTLNETNQRYSRQNHGYGHDRLVCWITLIPQALASSTPSCPPEDVFPITQIVMLSIRVRDMEIPLVSCVVLLGNRDDEWQGTRGSCTPMESTTPLQLVIIPSSSFPWSLMYHPVPVTSSFTFMTLKSWSKNLWGRQHQFIPCPCLQLLI